MNGKRGVPPMADPDQFTSINPTLHHSITPSLPRSLRLVTFSSYEKSSRPPLRRDEIDTLDVEIRAGVVLSAFGRRSAPRPGSRRAADRKFRLRRRPATARGEGKRRVAGPGAETGRVLDDGEREYREGLSQGT